MKTLKIFFAGLVCAFSACSSDDTTTINELDGLVLAREMYNDQHVVEIYTGTGQFTQGHNTVSVRIHNIENQQYINNAQISWLPVMHMATMDHSCPFTAPVKLTANSILYSGSIIFQMAGNDVENWSLKIDYSIDGSTYSVEEDIDVLPSELRTVNSFLGSDGSKYVVALIEPKEPAVAQNNMVAAVYKMESMMNYVPVSGYTLKIDPRMPGMGNHGSPNNLDLTASGAFYSGTLSLTMTGLWKINLILLAPDGTVIKGESVTESNLQSSIFFELEL